MRAPVPGPGARAPIRGLALVAALAAASPAAAAERESILVSAAASLGPALRDAGEAYESRYPRRRVLLNTASSGVLLRQIEHGAPADLFLSASPEEVDHLDRRGLLRPGTRNAVASNELVVVVPRGATPPDRVEDLVLPRFARIAVGNPSTVPAGRYARQSLQTLGIWEELRPRLVLAENARQALDYLARGEVDAAICYGTDPLLLPRKVTVGPRAPGGSHARIVYEGAVPAEAPHPQLGMDLLSFLVEDEGRRILARRGFLPPPDP